MDDESVHKTIAIAFDTTQGHANAETKSQLCKLAQALMRCLCAAQHENPFVRLSIIWMMDDIASIDQDGGGNDGDGDDNDIMPMNSDVDYNPINFQLYGCSAYTKRWDIAIERADVLFCLSGKDASCVSSGGACAGAATAAGAAAGTSVGGGGHERPWDAAMRRLVRLAAAGSAAGSAAGFGASAPVRSRGGAKRMRLSTTASSAGGETTALKIPEQQRLPGKDILVIEHIDDIELAVERLYQTWASTSSSSLQLLDKIRQQPQQQRADSAAAAAAATTTATTATAATATATTATVADDDAEGLLLDIRTLVPDAWRHPLMRMMGAEVWDGINQFLRVEMSLSDETILPTSDCIMRCFEFFPPSETRVVILGQDPYPTNPDGLAFSKSSCMDMATIPASLRTIVQELQRDDSVKKPLAVTSGDLRVWARQHVLLLNVTLTVRQGQSASHEGTSGWDRFTDKCVQLVSNESPACAFLLFGKTASAKRTLVNAGKHGIYFAAHPSPHNKGAGFIGSNVFSNANLFLKSRGVSEIEW